MSVAASSSQFLQQPLTCWSQQESKWKMAIDQTSGKVYYYHTETRETQWRKPMELASEEERQAMEAKEKRQRDFFAAMEANILKNLQAGQLVPAATSPLPINNNNNNISNHKNNNSNNKKKEKKEASNKQQLHPESQMSREECFQDDDESDSSSSSDSNSSRDSSDDSDSEDEKRPSLVRTISSMDERLLRNLVARVPSYRDVMKSSRNTTTTSDPNHEDEKEKEEDEEKATAAAQQQLSGGGQPQQRPKVSNSFRFSMNRDKSLTAVLATLPEEEESLSQFELDFGEQSFHGLSEEESQALSYFAAMSSQMALVGENDESFLEFSFTASNTDDDILTGASAAAAANDGGLGASFVVPEGEEEETSSNDDDKEEDDPFRNMILDPTAPNAKELLLRRESHRIVSSQTMGRPNMTRRNTCGTLYVGSTMAAPDIDATIKCVCGVIRAHIMQAEAEGPQDENSKFMLFNDLTSQQRRGSSLGGGVLVGGSAGAENNDDDESFDNNNNFHQTPSLDQICAFYRDIFYCAQMESDCVIMSLIYVERLIKVTKGRLRPRASNWRSVLFSSMVLASKVWDDLSMWNGDFSQTCPDGVEFSLKRINELELAVLEALSYKVKVPASEYAKYYFLLRAMLIKSGLGGDSMLKLNPLDVEGARRLQAVSSKYQRAANLRMVGNMAGRRSKSLNIEADINNKTSNKLGNNNRLAARKAGRGKVCLEHMVDM